MIQPNKLNFYLFIIFFLFLISCNNKNTKDKIPSEGETDSSLNFSNKVIIKSPLSYLISYNGKYQNDDKLIENEPLKTRINKILGTEYLTTLEICQREEPIKVQNDLDETVVWFIGYENKDFYSGFNYIICIYPERDEIYIGISENGQCKLFTETKTILLKQWGEELYPEVITYWKNEIEKGYADAKKSESEALSDYKQEITQKSKIGDEIYAGNFIYVVDRIEYLQKVENVFTSQTADGIYLIAYLTVVNTTRESRTLSSGMFKVFGSEGYEYKVSQNAITILILNDQDKVFLLKDIPPKIPKKIIVPFEVPTSNDEYNLQVSGGFWSGESKNILLKK